MDKSRLRLALLKRRRGLGAEQVRAWNHAIQSHLLSHGTYQSSASVLTYVSSKDNEVDTLPIIRDGLEMGKSIFVPRVAAGRMLQWVKLASIADLAPGPMGILEPRTGEAVSGDDGDLVLVPGIAFDRHGNRVGYGGGYFDRFLPRFRGIKIGLAFAAQVVEEVPSETYDMRVDWIITEFGISPCIPD
ncbi:MAG: 5-formyltetrahydrofolate cyclo-ligase [Candidatus Hydrogenedentota bacterium]